MVEFGHAVALVLQRGIFENFRECMRILLVRQILTGIAYYTQLTHFSTVLHFTWVISRVTGFYM